MHILTAARQTLASYPTLEAHSRRAASLVFEAAKLLKLPDPALLAQAAYLHDLGKAEWPAELFTKFPLARRLGTGEDTVYYGRISLPNLCR